MGKRTSGISHPTSDIRHPSSDIRHKRSDIQRKTSDIRHLTFLRDGPSENLLEARGAGARAKYQKNIRARENSMKKNSARQLILKSIHAMA